MKDYLDSIKDYFSQKATNPFLATILFIWIFKNWRLVYGLFTFDENATQATKLAYIENYFITYKFYPILAESILYAFGALISTYLLLSASRYIVDFYENKIYPRIRKANDDSSIVVREKHEFIVKELEEVRNNYNTEREAKIRTLGALKGLEEEIVKLTLEANKVPELKAINENFQNQEARLNEALQELDQIKRQNIRLDEERISAQKAYQALQQIHHKEKEQLTADFREKMMQMESGYVERIKELEQRVIEATAEMQRIVNNSLGDGRVPRGNTPRTSSGYTSA